MIGSSFDSRRSAESAAACFTVTVLSPTTAEQVKLSDMEWLCPTCATPAMLGKLYLSEDRFLLAVEYCKAVNDFSIYFDVCRQGIYIQWLPLRCIEVVHLSCRLS